MSRRTLLFVAAAILVAVTAAIGVRFAGPRSASNSAVELRLRLQWVPQAQFAGYLVADKLGYYQQEGLNVKILPAGPDIKPQNTVASGSDHIGIGVPNQVITARAEGVPLKIIAQIFRDSANRYVLKAKNRISDLSQIKGKTIGLWLGGDEAEFIAMLAKVGLSLSDVKVIPQEFSVAPFLQDQYVLSQVTTYNELIQIEDSGIKKDDLQILSPAEFGADIVADMIFTTQAMIDNRRADIIKFLRASVRGWEFALSEPDKTVDIIMGYNKELTKPDQIKQLRAVTELIKAGQATIPIGTMLREDYQRAHNILKLSKQLARDVPIDDIFDPGPLAAAKQ